eukprot:gb/GECG01000695.1/.p1 GENE.gb/GECG01000695.1/~~gb/GECG01000695.1/.p1  ORF type:complete len:201 (+),score=23.17 gb/GECG01000695.1/:1-603(+)
MQMAYDSVPSIPCTRQQAWHVFREYAAQHHGSDAQQSGTDSCPSSAMRVDRRGAKLFIWTITGYTPLTYEMEQLFGPTATGAGSLYLEFELLWNFIVKRTHSERHDTSDTRCGSADEAYNAIVHLCGGKDSITISELIKLSEELGLQLPPRSIQVAVQMGNKGQHKSKEAREITLDKGSLYFVLKQGWCTVDASHSELSR